MPTDPPTHTPTQSFANFFKQRTRSTTSSSLDQKRLSARKSKGDGDEVHAEASTGTVDKL